MESSMTVLLQTALKHLNILLVGSNGVGKTFLIEQFVSSKYSSNQIYLMQPQHGLEFVVSSIENNCTEVIIMDDVDVLLPKQQKSSYDRRFSLLVIRALKRATQQRNMMILASTSNLENINKELLLDGILHRIVHMKTPTFEERISQLNTYTYLKTGGDVNYIAQSTGGWNRAEIDSLAREIATNSNNERVDFIIARVRKTTSLFREIGVVANVENSSFTDGNQHSESKFNLDGIPKDICSLLHRCIISYFNNPNSSGTRGVLLHGPSGNGKTMLGLSLGNYIQQTGLGNFICVRCLDLVSKVVGETESNVSRMFARARDCAPCILFLDQLNALCPKRSLETQTTERTFDRVLSILLIELDGILTKYSNKSDSIVVLAATSKVSDLEPAIVRPGRLGTHVYINNPSSIEEYEEILVACTKMMPLQVNPLFFKTIIQEKLLLQHKSRADVNNLCREAAMISIRESLESSVIKEEHFNQVLSKW